MGVPLTFKTLNDLLSKPPPMRQRIVAARKHLAKAFSSARKRNVVFSGFSTWYNGKNGATIKYLCGWFSN